MSAEEKNRINYDVAKFLLYAVTLIVSVVLAYGNIDKRVTIIETEMQHKVDYIKLFEKLDLVKEDLKEDLSKKIAEEINKQNSRIEQLKKRESNGK
jgi:GTP-binding protein EngB required for normal cell division